MTRDPREIAQRIREVFMTRAKSDGIDEVTAILAAEMPRAIDREGLAKVIFIKMSANAKCKGGKIVSIEWERQTNAVRKHFIEVADKVIEFLKPLPSPPREEAK